MRRILSPTPRVLTQRSTEQRRAFQICAGLLLSFAAVVVVSGLFTRGAAPVGLLVMGGALVAVSVCILVVAARQQRIWIHGVEMLADVTLSKAYTFRWEFNGRGHTQQVGQQHLLWEDGRARILVDPLCPSRMIVATLEMIQVPSMSACIDGGGETLAFAPRPLNREFAMRQVRGMFAATAVLFVVACLVALVTSFFAADREKFLAEAKVLGSARVVAKSSGTVTYEFRGERHQFAATGKQQNRWPTGAGVAVWSYEGRMVAEPEMPGMPRAAAMFLSLLPVAIGVVIFFTAMQERQLRRRLWCHGVEVAATLVSDHTASGQREVVYRYAARGLRGVARQVFGASRRPLPTTDGWHVVVLARGNESRLLLVDEV